MPQSGYTGISFPFRVSNRGGVVMSTTSSTNAGHIEESLRQIFGTNYLERPMEAEIYSNISSLLFEPNNATLQEVLKSRMVDSILRLEERVECENSDIDFVVETEEDIEFLYALITYRVIKYNTYYTSKIKIGEVNNE